MIKLLNFLPFYVISIAMYIFNNISNAKLITNNANIYSGEGFLAYMRGNDTEFNASPLIDCHIIFNDSTIYNLNPRITNKLQTVRHEFLQRFSINKCGVRITNVTNQSVGIWRLNATNENGEWRSADINVNILPKRIDPTSRQLIVDIGQSVTITCPKDFQQKLCRIIDPHGSTVKLDIDGCSITFEAKQNETWICKQLTYGRMLELSETIDIIVRQKKQSGLTTSYIDTEDAIILKCVSSKPTFQCHAESPDINMTILLTDGLMTHSGDYSAYDTNLQEGVCSLEIRKPLKNEDIGIWRMYQQSSSKSISGCVFIVGQNTTEIFHILNQHLESNVHAPTRIDVMEDNKLTIKCQVPYPIDYCYLRSPNMTIQYMMDYNFERTRYMGRCEFNVARPISGLWICAFNSPANTSHRFIDIERHFDVNVFGTDPGVAIPNKIIASNGERIRIGCRTPMERIVKHCAFIHPSGKIFKIEVEQVKRDVGRFRYFGSGLINGECKIEIIYLRNEDFGQWRCTLQISQYKEIPYSYTIDLIKNPSAPSSIRYTTIVVLMITTVILLGLSILYKHRKKTTHNFNELVSLEDLNSNKAH